MASKTEPPPRRAVVGDPEAASLRTNIDRRQCKRVVPMKILCLGVSRTGTSSLRQALFDLGYSDVYHFASIHNENPRDSEMWLEAFDVKISGKGKPFEREQWDQLLGHCMVSDAHTSFVPPDITSDPKTFGCVQAVTDAPCTFFYHELLAAYPDAKVILTVRDSPQQWWRSQMATIMPFFRDYVFSTPVPPLWDRLYNYFRSPTVSKIDMTYMHMNTLIPVVSPMYAALKRDMENGTRESEQWYQEYNAEIQKIVPREKLLVMNVKQGWAPLCRFLGKDVPAWSFPRVNSEEDFRERLRLDDVEGSGGQWRTFGAIAFCAAAVAVGAGWWRGGR